MRFVVCASAIFVASVGSSSVSGQPVKWLVVLGGNGNFYELVISPLSWTDARDAAAAISFNGQPGHLATITSVEEDAFLLNTFVIPNGQASGTWLGLTDELQEGVFEWVTGEPTTYSGWLPGEPNNSLDEDYVHYKMHAGEWGWNDHNNFTLNRPYLVEYTIIDGDATGDGIVGADDYTIWANNFGISGATKSQGDFNLDTFVSAADYTIWANTFGGFPESGAVSIPEPSTLTLAGFGLVSLLADRRRRRRRVG